MCRSGRAIFIGVLFTAASYFYRRRPVYRRVLVTVVHSGHQPICSLDIHTFIADVIVFIKGVDLFAVPLEAL